MTRDSRRCWPFCETGTGRCGDELYFQVPGEIEDLGRLEGLFDLFSEVLHRLCHMGAAYQDDPHVDLE